MKFPSRYDVGIGLFVALVPLIVVGRWAFRAANRGGFPFFSFATLEAIWPGVALLVVASVGVAIAGRKSK